jgi:hypothetical protein
MFDAAAAHGDETESAALRAASADRPSQIFFPPKDPST